MKWIRYVFFTLTMLIIVGLLVSVSGRGLRTPLGKTFSPLFSFLGRGSKTADRLLGRVVPVDQIDEKLLGNALKQNWRLAHRPLANKRQEYVNRLLADMTARMSVHFSYEAFLISGPPNAAALPGGVILVTESLFSVVKSEAQLVSILGHEIGHIERGHCFDSAKFQLASRKFSDLPLGELADAVYGMMVRHTFSKTQEMESDNYAFDTVKLLDYDPYELARAFENLEASENRFPGDDTSSPLRDYFSSHPPMKLRIENGRERARRFLAAHPEKKYYVGLRNLEILRTRSEVSYPEELIVPYQRN